MREVQWWLWFAVRGGLGVLSLCALMLAASPYAFANTIHVPEDYPTIQAAVIAAEAGDIIRVGPGQWCGARITKQLDLEAEGGATIIGCPAGTPGPFGRRFRVGFFLNPAASGTTIRHFTFDGQGWSATNTDPLAEGVSSFIRGPNDVTVEDNRFLGGLLGVQAFGSGWSIHHNVFDGFTIDPVTGVGGGAIVLFGLLSRQTSNTVSFNKITATVPAGAFPSFVTQINIPFLGVIAAGQDSVIITNNTVSIVLGPGATGATAGILVSDGDFNLTSINSVIVNNDGRGSTYAVVITLDLFGGTGNTVNTTLRGNFGINLINTTTTDVLNRSIHTLMECNPSEVCP